MTGVEPITMPKAEAWGAYLEYLAAFKASRNKQDAALARGYRTIAKGKKVLNVFAALRAAGVDSEGRPRLAICRASEEHCQLRLFHNGGAVYVGGTTRWVRANSRKQTYVPEDTFPRRDQSLDAAALVPLIPPRFRPPSALAGYHLLWEAEWRKAAPVDPLLLKHLGGPLYAVLAQWDLTPLERAVLAGRL